MTYPRWWDEAEVRRYFPIEALTKDREVFERVHLPIDRILVDRSRRRVPHRRERRSEAPDSPEILVTSEAELLAHLRRSAPADPNRIVMVVGETGSGKSELCQALHYALDDGGDHVPILIYRSRTRLRDIVGEIEAKLGEAGPPPLELDRVSPEQFGARIKAALLTYVDSPVAPTVFGPANVAALRQILALPHLEVVLQRVYGRYREELAQPGGVRLPDLLPLDDFKEITRRGYEERGVSLRPYPAGSGGSAAEAVYRRLEPRVREALAQLLQIEDLIDKVRRLSDRFAAQGRRPTLLIEDITTFGFLQNDLLDYLFDLSAGHYDVVLGITTDFERFNQEGRLGPLSTVADRLEARLQLTEGGSTLFAERHYLELARRHLAGVVRPPEPLPPWLAAFDGCYPFLPTTIGRIWSGLQDGGSPKRTPRLLLRFLRDVLEDERPPAERLQGLVGAQLHPPPLDTPPTVPADLRLLARWYGTPARDGISVPVAALAAFGVAETGGQRRGDWVVVPLTPALRSSYARIEPPVPAPGAAPPGEADAADRAAGGAAVAGATGGAEAPSGSVAMGGTTPDGTVAGGTAVGPADGPAEDPALARLREAYAGLRAWLEGAREFPHRERLARGVMTGLEFFGLRPEDLARPGAIAGRSRAVVLLPPTTRESRVAFEGLPNDRDVTRLPVPRRPADQEALEWLLRVEMEGRALGAGPSDGGDAPPDGGGAPLVVLHDYLSARVAQGRSRAEAALEEALHGLPLAVVAATAKFLLLNGAGLLPVPDTLGLTRPLPAGGKEEGFPAEGPVAALDRAWAALTLHFDAVEGLFGGAFFLQGAFVDHDRLAAAVDLLSDPSRFLATLEGIARIETARLENRFALGRLPQPELAETLRALQEYARAVRAWSVQGPVHAAEARRDHDRLRRLLPAPDELPRVRAHVEELLDFFDERKERVTGDWRAAHAGLADGRVAEEVGAAGERLDRVEDGLGRSHPASTLHAARWLRAARASPMVGHLSAADALARAVRNDLTLGFDERQGSQATALAAAMGRLREAIG